MTVTAAIDLGRIGPGFVDPVHGAQRGFRMLLEAMSRPARVQTMPPDLLAGPPAPGLGLAATAALLALLDEQVQLWLSPTLRRAGCHDFLRFHTGVSLADEPQEADFAVLPAAEGGAELWSAMRLGTDTAPQDGATLLIDGAGLAENGGLGWQGPGIETVQRLAATRLDDAFWAARQALASDYPRGIDLLLCDGAALAALPRTTQRCTED